MERVGVHCVRVCGHKILSDGPGIDSFLEKLVSGCSVKASWNGHNFSSVDPIILIFRFSESLKIVMFGPVFEKKIYSM